MLGDVGVGRGIQRIHIESQRNRKTRSLFGIDRKQSMAAMAVLDGAGACQLSPSWLPRTTQPNRRASFDGTAERGDDVGPCTNGRTLHVRSVKPPPLALTLRNPNDSHLTAYSGRFLTV
ncbi:hypothetical protein GW17_00059105 [Ensete ventricosum]|nr:hypothetical protein GW17_00059105 [Ensete ventricosum]